MILAFKLIIKKRQLAWQYKTCSKSAHEFCAMGCPYLSLIFVPVLFFYILPEYVYRILMARFQHFTSYVHSNKHTYERSLFSGENGGFTIIYHSKSHLKLKKSTGVSTPFFSWVFCTQGSANKMLQFCLLPSLHTFIVTLMFSLSVISSDELTVIESKLPEPLKINMEKEYYKRLEFEFHASGYHIMQATTTGIRIAAGHLVQVWNCMTVHIASLIFLMCSLSNMETRISTKVGMLLNFYFTSMMTTTQKRKC